MEENISKSKKYYIMVGFILLFVTISLGNPCYGGELKRDVAGKMLLNKIYHFNTTRLSRSYEYGMPRVNMGGNTYGGIKYDNENHRATQQMYQKLKINEFIEINDNKDRMTWEIISTDKLKPYIKKTDDYNYEIVVEVVRVNKITGIAKHPLDQSARVVEFTVKSELTPLADMLPKMWGNFDTKKTYEVIMKEYDDGWRLAK